MYQKRPVSRLMWYFYNRAAEQDKICSFAEQQIYKKLVRNGGGSNRNKGLRKVTKYTIIKQKGKLVSMTNREFEEQVKIQQEALRRESERKAKKAADVALFAGALSGNKQISDLCRSMIQGRVYG